MFEVGLEINKLAVEFLGDASKKLEESITVSLDHSFSMEIISYRKHLWIALMQSSIREYIYCNGFYIPYIFYW